MKNHGFTLIELLVAITISVVMTGMVVVITSESLAFWGRTQSSTTTLAQAQLALDQLEHDLQGAIQREVNKPWISVLLEDTPAELEERGWDAFDETSIKPKTKSDDAGGITTLIAEAFFGRGGAWLRFFTTNNSSGGSRPAAVSYQIVRSQPGAITTGEDPAESTSSLVSTSMRYMLMRSEMDQDDSFRIIDTLFDSRDILLTPNASDVFALNVVDFGIWFYHRNTAGKLERISPTLGLSSYELPQAEEIPSEADLMVRLLSDQGAVLVSNIESGFIQMPPEFQSRADWWWATVEANSRVYVRHINLLNYPR